jgi:hypothetical protein
MRQLMAPFQVNQVSRLWRMYLVVETLRAHPNLCRKQLQRSKQLRLRRFLSALLSHFQRCLLLRLSHK